MSSIRQGAAVGGSDDISTNGVRKTKIDCSVIVCVCGDYKVNVITDDEYQVSKVTTIF